MKAFGKLLCWLNFHDFKTIWTGWEKYVDGMTTITRCKRKHCNIIRRVYDDLFSGLRPGQLHPTDSWGLDENRKVIPYPL